MKLKLCRVEVNLHEAIERKHLGFDGIYSLTLKWQLNIDTNVAYLLLCPVLCDNISAEP